MLERIVIENYRSCLRTSLSLHPQLSVLIGPNGSGKTNILQAIMLLNRLTRYEGDWPSEDISTVGSRIKAYFSVSGLLTRLNATVQLHADETNTDVITGSRQKWAITSKKGDRETVELPMFSVEENVAGIRLTPYSIKYVNFLFRSSSASKRALSNIRQVATFCRGIRYYGASQFTNPSRCPVSFEIEIGRSRPKTRFPKIAKHGRILNDIYSAYKKDPRGRYDQFMSIVGPNGLKLIDDLTFEEVETSSIEHLVRIGGNLETRHRNRLLIIPRFFIGKQRLSPNQLSEGTFKTLSLLFYVITEDTSALLVEEPEVCVHHGLLSSILDLIKSYSKQKQMIITTHSDYVLDHVSPENVLRVAYDKDSGTSVRSISRIMTTKELAALKTYLQREGNLGDYWREGGLGD